VTNGKPAAARLERWVDAVGSATLPVLAGFSTTSVIVVSDDAANFRWPGATILALAIASILLILAVQFAYHARIDLSDWSERKESLAPLLEGDGGDTDTRDVISHRQDRDDYQMGLTWTKRTQRAYRGGHHRLAKLAGLGLAVAPHHATGIQDCLQWLATFLAFLVCIGEAIWVRWGKRH
jgi:hypothetical protein